MNPQSTHRSPGNEDEAARNPEAVYLSRQPIYDRKLQLHGYELLYRSSVSNVARFRDGDRATAQVIHNAIELGLDQVIGDETAFVNLTPNFILDDFCRSLPRDRIVLEVNHKLLSDGVVLERLLALHREGFRIAIDEFRRATGVEHIDRLSAIVKVDITSLDAEQLMRTVSVLRDTGSRMLAEKVETGDELDLCRDLGFDLFQGFFFSKPRLMQGRQIPVNRLSAMRLVTRLQDPRTRAEDLEALIRQDVTLSYKLLRFVNSAYCGVPRKVESIAHATVMIGLDRLRTWSSLLMLGSIEDKPRELVRTAVVRARMCEEMALAVGISSPESYFTVGLLSVLDALLDTRMADVVRRLPLTEQVAEALLMHTHRQGQLLALAIAYEQDDAPLVTELCRQTGLSSAAATQAYLTAIRWSDDVAREMGIG